MGFSPNSIRPCTSARSMELVQNCLILDSGDHDALFIFAPLHEAHQVVAGVLERNVHLEGHRPLLSVGDNGY